MKKVIVKKIYTYTPCYCCDPIGGTPIKRGVCKVCKGSGKYRDYHYFITVGKNCFDGDTLK